MKTQQVVAPPRPLKTAKPLTAALNPQDADFLAHPHLTPAVDPLKGRLLRASATIRAGTVVLRDTPYAIVPLPTQGSLICSNLACSRRVAVNCTRVVHCPRTCAEDVIWCGLTCRNADLKRHEFECQWLKTQGQVCRAQESQYDFVTLWHVVRLLAGWSLELQKPNLSCKANRDGRFKWNWESVLMCCDYLDSWPEEQLQHWKRLAETYMMAKKLLPCPLNLEAMMSLICKEETNTFGLYPNVTGLMQGAQARGESYGLSLYPRAAQFNHSCRPNVSGRHAHRKGGSLLTGD